MYKCWSREKWRWEVSFLLLCVSSPNDVKHSPLLFRSLKCSTYLIHSVSHSFNTVMFDRIVSETPRSLTDHNLEHVCNTQRTDTKFGDYHSDRLSQTVSWQQEDEEVKLGKHKCLKSRLRWSVLPWVSTNKNQRNFTDTFSFSPSN